jgi:hypothetical protein
MKTEYKDKLSEEDIKTLDEAINEAKGKAEVTDKDELEAALKGLNEKLMPIGTKMYQQAQAETPAGEAETGGEKADDSKKAETDEPIEGEVVDDKKEK